MDKQNFAQMVEGKIIFTLIVF